MTMKPRAGKGKANPPRPWEDDRPRAVKPARRPLIGKAIPRRSEVEEPERPEGATARTLPPPRRADSARRTPQTPAQGLRDRVWVVDKGRCVGCSKRLPREAGIWVWQVHHPIPQQKLKREGLEFFCGDERAAVLLCKRCHERHETVSMRVPSERLPERVHDLVAFLGPRFIDLLDRLHPNERSRP